MNIFYNMQQYLNLRNKSQHHIIKMTLLFWVWKPSEKPKIGKSVQQLDIDFIMRKYGIHPNLTNVAPGRITRQIPAKPQHPPV